MSPRESRRNNNPSSEDYDPESISFKYSEQNTRAREIHEKSLLELGRDLSPTLEQIKQAIRLQMDPSGLSMPELQDLFNGRADDAKRKSLALASRTYLEKLVPENAHLYNAASSDDEIASLISHYARALMEKFPIQSALSFQTPSGTSVTGILMRYYRNPPDSVQYKFAIKGARTWNFPLYYLHNATMMDAYEDTGTAAKELLKKRVEDLVTEEMKRHVVDQTSAVRNTVTLVMRALTKKGYAQPDSITDDQIQQAICDLKGETY